MQYSKLPIFLFSKIFRRYFLSVVNSRDTTILRNSYSLPMIYKIYRFLRKNEQSLSEKESEKSNMRNNFYKLFAGYRAIIVKTELNHDTRFQRKFSAFYVGLIRFFLAPINLDQQQLLWGKLTQLLNVKYLRNDKFYNSP